MLGGKWLDRIDNWGVWLLLFVVLAYVLTGYGMTKNIMDPLIAKYIHARLLPLPLFLFFLVHVLKPVRAQFKNWKIFKNDEVLDVYVYLLGLTVFAIFVWLFFR